MPETPQQDAFERGLALHRQGKLPEAAACYRQALSERDDDHRALHWLGVLAQQNGDVKAAESLMRSAIAFAEDEPDYRVSLGLLLQRTGRPRKALAAYREALDIEPRHYQAHYRVALLLHRMGELEAALESYRVALSDNEEDAALQVNAGALLNLLGRADEAVPLYRKALQIDPNLPAAHGNLGNALASLKRYDEAIAAFRRSITLEPHQPTMYANLASCLLASGAAEGAKHAFENCLRRAPGDITSLAMLAAIHTEQHSEDSARALLDYATLLDAGPVRPPAAQTPEAWLAELNEFVLNHPTLAADPDSHTTRAGQQTGALLPTRNPAIGHLVSGIRERVGNYIERRPVSWSPLDGLGALWPAPAAWRLDMWATVLHAGGHQAPHIHPSGWLSGVFYVDCPMKRDDPSQEGWIEFGRPPADLPLAAEPLTHRHQPGAGELVLFPSYFYHRTLPLEGSRPRISIAFDVIPRRDRLPRD